MSTLDWLAAGDATVSALQPGEHDPDGDPVSYPTLVIDDRWSATGLVISSETKEQLRDFLTEVQRAVNELLQD